ncbi:hypothetical protein SCE1572_01780 [Sorangium cellulosum So0157-2]|uniref:Uncharacterized protein n=1 Tax=Sorangium cellulosum So0157-2 TaxID=1254432 RepID=S4XLC9_SORCE|nr:hypothetical protein SCE1572_01780 [Sorangium cellulosum So0157-2]
MATELFVGFGAASMAERRSLHARSASFCHDGR